VAYDPAARPIDYGTLTAGSALFGGQARLCGGSLRNTSTTATAVVDLYDGGGSGGQPVANVNLAANESTRDWLSGEGLRIRTGLYVNVTSGSVRVVLWVRFPIGGDVEVDPA